MQPSRVTTEIEAPAPEPASPPRAAPRHLAINFLYLSGGECVAKLLTFVSFTFMSRLLGPTNYGFLEFTIAVAASVAADLSARKLGVGLFSTGTVEGLAIAHQPSTSPDTLARILELLARASPFGSVSLADALTMEGRRLPHGTSIVVVAADFPEDTLVAVGELRRRHLPVTAVAVATDRGVMPPADLFDDLLIAEFTGDWPTRPTLQLAA